MGFTTLKELLNIKEADVIRVLLLKKEKRNKLVTKLAKKANNRIEIMYGDVAEIEDLRKLCQGVDYLLNLAGVIPPLSDKKPELSYRANELGVYNVVKVCEENPDIKLIDITSIALYGHRNIKHPFVRIGDPLISSAYDFYSTHKQRGEFAILESNIKHFAIIRQTAMIYEEMLMSNRTDGLIFHTGFNDPLEWSSTEDTAILLSNIIKENLLGHLNYDNFWNKVYNLGAGEINRMSGFDTLEAGFKIFGGSAKKCYQPNFNTIRNFHGGFYYDGDVLENLFHYQHDKVDEYWYKILKKYPYLKLGRLCPAKLMKKFAIESVFKDDDAPAYWYKHNDIARLTAFFGGKEQYEKLPKSWDEFKLEDLRAIRSNKNYKPLDYGFDIEKSDKDITLEDLQNVAKMHGGKLLDTEFTKGDVYRRLMWVNQDGQEFMARPYTILRGGHWMNSSYKEYVWEYDRLCKKDKIFAQIWYDTHEKDENICYYFDENLKACIK